MEGFNFLFLIFVQHPLHLWNSRAIFPLFLAKKILGFGPSQGHNSVNPFTPVVPTGTTIFSIFYNKQLYLKSTFAFHIFVFGSPHPDWSSGKKRKHKRCYFLCYELEKVKKEEVDFWASRHEWVNIGTKITSRTIFGN